VVLYGSIFIIHPSTATDVNAIIGASGRYREARRERGSRRELRRKKLACGQAAKGKLRALNYEEEAALSRAGRNSG
jgi:hypothetical protein